MAGALGRREMRIAWPLTTAEVALDLHDWPAIRPNLAGECGSRTALVAMAEPPEAFQEVRCSSNERIQPTSRMAMRTRVQFTYLALVFALPIYLALQSVAVAAESILVNGVVSEQFVHGNPFQTPHGDVVEAEDEWSGTLVGDGVVHAFSSDFVPPNTSLNVVSERKLFTTDGNLFLSEVGDRYGSLVEVV